MDQTESEDTSNDTTMISELLKSAEVMPSQSQLIADPSMTTTTTSVGGLGKDVMRHHQHHHHMMSTTNTSSEQHPIDIPPLAAIGSSGPAANMMILNQGFASHVTDNSNKVHHRHVHIPYILNGELYQIQTQDGENVTVKCCHCPPDRVYRGSVRSTGNFHMHIKVRNDQFMCVKVTMVFWVCKTNCRVGHKFIH